MGLRVKGGKEQQVLAGANRALKAFLEQVDVGRGQRGVNAFLDQYLDSMLMFGQGVGEMVLSADRREIAALLCGRAGCPFSPS